jgi:IclR family acetate operon transcriptional repressor
MLLETIADNDGIMSLSRLAAESNLPLPTIHRLIRTLVDLGYMRQEPSREYSLGPRLIRLGESSSKMLTVWARPHLKNLVNRFEESANLAMLDGDQIVYVAQVQSQQSMRMFTEVGRRVLPHSTAVGKAIMVNLPRERVRGILARTGMPKYTEQTLTTPEDFEKALDWTAQHGYGIDDAEQEAGVRCVAVAVPGIESLLAISLSGPTERMSHKAISDCVPYLNEAAIALAKDLS